MGPGTCTGASCGQGDAGGGGVARTALGFSGVLGAGAGAPAGSSGRRLGLGGVGARTAGAGAAGLGEDPDAHMGRNLLWLSELLHIWRPVVYVTLLKRWAGWAERATGPVCSRGGGGHANVLLGAGGGEGQAGLASAGPSEVAHGVPHGVLNCHTHAIHCSRRAKNPRVSTPDACQNPAPMCAGTAGARGGRGWPAWRWTPSAATSTSGAGSTWRRRSGGRRRRRRRREQEAGVVMGGSGRARAMRRRRREAGRRGRGLVVVQAVRARRHY